MDLVGILAEGTMKAAAMIIADRNLPKMTDKQLDDAAVAMREEILSGYKSAAAEAKEALDVLGLEQAKYVLNVNCNLFAARALRKVGLLPEQVTNDAIFEGVKE